MASLVSRIADLAAAVRDKFNAIAPRLVATGGTTGQVYTKTSGAHAWADAGAVSNWTKRPVYFDDFLCGSTEAGEIGDLGWTMGNGSVAPVIPELNHPGVQQRTSGTTIDQVASMNLNLAVSADTLLFSQFDELTWLIKLDSTATDFRLRFGLAASASVDGSVTHAVYFERLATETSWYGVSRNGGSQSRTAALASITTNWIKLKVRRVNATTVAFSVDGGAEVTLTTTIPDATDTLTPFNHIVPTTTTARTFQMDAFEIALLSPTR